MYSYSQLASYNVATMSSSVNSQDLLFFELSVLYLQGDRVHTIFLQTNALVGILFWINNDNNSLKCMSYFIGGSGNQELVRLTIQFPIHSKKEMHKIIRIYKGVAITSYSGKMMVIQLIKIAIYSYIVSSNNSILSLFDTHAQQH